MTHVRQKIREAARLRLTGLATTGDRVFRHHHALGDDDTPALRVTTMNERSERDGDATGGVLHRTVELVVEAWATGGDDLEDTLDRIAAEVEQAVDADDTFGDLATDTVLETTEKTIDADSDRRVGRLTLTFAVRIMTHRGDPTLAL